MNFGFPPILPVLVHFPPDWRKLLFPPTFTNFPPVFGKFTSFLHTFWVFPPYFDHDAFMVHPMHVLDAPGLRTLYLTILKNLICVDIIICKIKCCPFMIY